ncbi:hypothetical protein [Herbaspirillum huttiense]|uniref:hypothetical protein n=1 Tax=Herbaspirillum huttiense TaxID=863372 RepID=UPI002E75E46D|nr:hypothetical protein [Herbaspirillum huttiense]MEE1636323.1 hypothetical protein [Herbaspirillum huttiense NC40101]
MFEAYKIGIRIQVLNFASQGLAMLGADLMKTHGMAAKLENSLKAVKIAGIGLASAKMGDGMLGFLEKSVKLSKEYTRQLSLMESSGSMNPAEIAEATSAAWKTAREVITTTPAENLEAIRELRSVFGADHMHEAYAVLPFVQRAKSVMEALSGKEQHGVAFDMMKAIDLRGNGAMTIDQVVKNADMMTQTLMAMGGTLNVHDYHMALKQAKTSGMRLDDTFVYKYLPTFMQELKTGTGGAMSAGTIMETLRRSVAGGRIPEKMIPNWLASGMLTEEGVGHGGAKNRFIKPGSIAGTEMLLSNPFQWANEVAAPAIEKLMKAKNVGFDTATAMLFGDRNAEFGVSTFIKKAQQFERDRKLIEKGNNSYDTYQALLKSNPQMAEMALQKKWEESMAIIGYQILPILIPYMQKFATMLDDVGQWMERNQSTVKAVALGFAGLAVAEAVLGRVLMYGAFIKFFGLGPMIGTAMRAIGTGIMFLARAFLLNPIGLAITGIAAAAYLLWKNWDTVGPWLQGIWDGIKNGVSALVEWFASKWKWFAGLFGGGDSPKEGAPGTVERERDKFISPREARVMLVNTQINLDGRPMANSLASYLVREVVRPTGGSAFDPNQALAPAGMPYAR